MQASRSVLPRGQCGGARLCRLSLCGKDRHSTEGQCVRTKVINLIKVLTARALELFLGLTGKQDEKFDILSVAW